MKISEAWLREWVNVSLSAQEMANVFTMAGLEVDSVQPVAGEFQGVVVAEVVETMPHPKANRLTLCKVLVQEGKELLQVVCGASNVRPGLKVALAQIGASLPGDIYIKEVHLREVLSQGMLCSAAELGIADNFEGIMELEDDAPLGVDLTQYLSLRDTVLDMDLTPNRADCLSILGLARELALLTQETMHPIPMQKVLPNIDAQKEVQVQNPALCPLYCSRIIKGISTTANTPLWMREKLRRSAIRCIHPVVDVLNFVMIELGQPMHAFDLSLIKGEVSVRTAHLHESIILLDGQEITLRGKEVVIADEEKILALAGIMGGESSAVQEGTVDILLESAYFPPKAVAGIARSYGLVTDASQRFERGVDYQLQVIALERVTGLLLSIVGGEPGPIFSQVHTSFVPVTKTILFDPSEVYAITGVSVPEARILAILQNLGMKVDNTNLPWQLLAPSHRVDIQEAVDLVEEILRVYGYDNIPHHPITSTLVPGSLHSLELCNQKVSTFLALKGYQETITYSFVDEKLQTMLFPELPSFALANPLSRELSHMRVSLWPGLLASMIYNAHRQQAAFKLFETAVVFTKPQTEIQEEPCFAGLLVGEKGALHWGETKSIYDFYDAKGDLQALFAFLQYSSVYFESTAHSALHPGKSASICLDGQTIGFCGVLHPRIAAALDIHEEVVLFEVRLTPLLQPNAPTYRKISKFPSIRRDLSLLVDKDIPVVKIEKIIKETIPEIWLTSFHVFDVYQDEKLPPGKKSIAVAMILQDDQRTLVDSEINSLIDVILKKLLENLAITLRE